MAYIPKFPNIPKRPLTRAQVQNRLVQMRKPREVKFDISVKLRWWFKPVVYVVGCALIMFDHEMDGFIKWAVNRGTVVKVAP